MNRKSKTSYPQKGSILQIQQRCVKIPLNIILTDFQLIGSYPLDTPLPGAIIKEKGGNELSGKITDYLEVDPFIRNKGKK